MYNLTKKLNVCNISVADIVVKASSTSIGHGQRTMAVVAIAIVSIVAAGD